MWRVGAVPNISYDYRDDAVPGFVPPPPKKLRSKRTKDDSSLPKSKTTISLHSTESDDTTSTKSSGTDHVSSEDVKPPKSPLTSPLRLLRRNRDAFPDARGVPPVPPLPIAFPGHEEQLTEPPAEAPAWSLSGSLHRVLVKRPSLLRTKSRPSLEDADRPLPEMPSWALGDEGTGGRATHPIVSVDTATPPWFRRRDENADTTPTPTPVASPVPSALFRTNTIDSIASSITTIQFASPISSGAAGKYQSTVAQDPDVEETAEGAEDDEDWRLEGGSWNPRLKRSGSLSKAAKRLGLEEGARKTATPPAVPRPGPSRPQPSWSAALPLAPPPIAPPPRPAKSPARIAAAAAKHNRRWSISSFAPSEPDADAQAAGETALAAGARSETHTFVAPSRTRQPRALPIPPGFFTHDGAADEDPEDESDSEAGRTAAVLRSEYLPVRSSSKPTDGLLSPEGYASRRTDHEQSWYGEWNRGNMQDVITSLRELR